MYGIVTPTGKTLGPPKGRCWGATEPEYLRLQSEGRVYFPKKGNGRPRIKTYKGEEERLVPMTLWMAGEVGDNDKAKKHVNDLASTEDAFDTPKPEQLIARILEIATNQGDLVLDSFAGSGTTGATAIKMKRNFLMVEMGEHASSTIAPRLKKVISGSDPGGITEERGWEGGDGFRFCTLGESLFDAEGNVGSTVTFSDLAAHVFFCETGSPLPKRADGSSPLIGTFQRRAIYLLFSPASVGLPSVEAGNVLTAAALRALPSPGPDFMGTGVVYAEGCTVPDDRLAAANVTFRQVPYQIEGI
jgi:hypothetical protein